MDMTKTNGHTNGVGRRNGLSDHRGRMVAASATVEKDRRPMSVQIEELNDRVSRQLETIDAQRAEMEHFAQHHDEHVRELTKQVEAEREQRYKFESAAGDIESKLRTANGQINALKNAIASLIVGVQGQPVS